MPSSSSPKPDHAVKETFKGSCHCGNVTFEFQHPPIQTSTVTSCNCSLCSQRGYLFIYLTDIDKDFKFTKGSWDDLKEYRFHKRQTGHWFCPICGSGLLENVREEFMGINVRVVEGVDLDTLTLEKDDGRSRR